MVQAYILVQTEVGMADRVSADVSAIEGVVRVDIVTGPYDVVALTEAASADHLRTLVVSRVQRVAGITRTLTCSILTD
ncbi:Lrp/AsnC ligand binding domain-containing protein [Glycomyces algeriensis]|jgi:DNA-binding Lrp family transcriptional regulator|uniref:AsnC family transcriptional regulator n=1 Tax=Glycomyces algeriensis TaxID=256037 RepID=A0A9W6GBB6_9ACTN|nr:Lrp/AsnC ligand binding domain-containing protein [Glycomyces algeriensis]GLI44884.1 AsnC family transcriptional regulator [Glycomyces algeriensis]